MSDVAIRVDGLSKVYRLSNARKGHDSFRDLVASAIASPFRRLLSLRHGVEADSEEFWALRDVSFEVRRGSVVGLIGRNGAGKSTLLKILSRIVEPTSGEAVLRGRIASLLEVGTGFHPELSGRENIFLNGAIMGMRRSEIAARFDEIVAFAEVERFLDTPVKRYSSGMYVRLAFAVAAHLEPDILIVDEVLAVGDAEFQKKCMGKMRDVASTTGRTVLFVSHNMQAVRALCTDGIVLANGSTSFLGDAGKAIDHYTALGAHASGARWVADDRTRRRDTPLRFAEVSLALRGTQPDLVLTLQGRLERAGACKGAFLAVDVLDAAGVAIMQAIPTLDPSRLPKGDCVDFTIDVELKGLIPGSYGVTVWCGPHNTETYDLQTGILAFDVTDTPQPGRTVPHTVDHGHVVPRSDIRFS